jgi:hypothetical protein
VKENGFSLPEFKFEEFALAMAATKADFENNNGLPCKDQSLYLTTSTKTKTKNMCEFT